MDKEQAIKELNDFFKKSQVSQLPEPDLVVTTLETDNMFVHYTFKDLIKLAYDLS